MNVIQLDQGVQVPAGDIVIQVQRGVEEIAAFLVDRETVAQRALQVKVAVGGRLEVLWAMVM